MVKYCLISATAKNCLLLCSKYLGLSSIKDATHARNKVNPPVKANINLQYPSFISIPCFSLLCVVTKNVDNPKN